MADSKDGHVFQGGKKEKARDKAQELLCLFAFHGVSLSDDDDLIDLLL